MSSAAYLAKTLDLRKGESECNALKCVKMPTKEVILIEVDLARSKKREIATVYMCADHYKNIQNMMEDIKNISSGKVIEKKTFDIGFITY